MMDSNVSHPHNTNMEVWYKYIDSQETCRGGKPSKCAVCGRGGLMWAHAVMSNLRTLKLTQNQKANVGKLMQEKKKKKKEEKGEDSFKLHLRPNVAFPSVRELLLVVTKELWSLVSK